MNTEITLTHTGYETMFKIKYDKKSMCLSISVGKYYKAMECPFATWWKARKYFRRPKFRWYFGPTFKKRGKNKGEFWYEQKGIWPSVSTEFLKRYSPKFLPITVLSWDVGWKDKYNTPRFEHNGYFAIFFGRDYRKCWQLSLIVSAPDVYSANDCTAVSREDLYWESMLWYLHYNDVYNPEGGRDINKARGTMSEHWWAYKTETVKDVDTIASYGKETLSTGFGRNEEYAYVDVCSDSLHSMIESESSCGFSANHNVTIQVEVKDDEYSVRRLSTHTKFVAARNDNETDDRVRLFFKDNSGDILYTLESGKYERLVLIHSQKIDNGPSFKDEFLNETGVAEIRRLKRLNDGNTC